MEACHVFTYITDHAFMLHPFRPSLWRSIFDKSTTSCPTPTQTHSTFWRLGKYHDLVSIQTSFIREREYRGEKSKKWLTTRANTSGAFRAIVQTLKLHIKHHYAALNSPSKKIRIVWLLVRSETMHGDRNEEPRR